ncbi:MAG: MmgE/PrpD family protein, partial [Desulfosarcina sp.]|nr:MmgE/PrpD family protein [Desulfobacterales bacterium]
MNQEVVAMTKKLARFVTKIDAKDIPAHVFDHAKVAFLDWIAVTLAGKDDPAVKKLLQYSETMGGNKQATVLGHGTKTNISHATLINGTASHALDYDDTLEVFLGHPSVTIFPSLLALGEWTGKSGPEFLSAYITGLKVGAVIGACGGMDHYMSGWHATSTLGHFASAAGGAKLMGLDEGQKVNALGIAGTQASGLKRVFGTMCKPFHAGRSSQAGMLSALLAENGFTSAEDILEGNHGFFHVLNGKVNDKVLGTLGKTWDIENLAQKYHASCHATHSPIEGTLSIMQENRIALEDIASIRIFCSQLSLDAAGNNQPRSGLEGKFSISYCVANALNRKKTGIAAFSDVKVNDPEIKEFMKKISVAHTEDFKGLEARIELETNSGAVYNATSNILKDIPGLEEKKVKIGPKFGGLCSPLLGNGRTRD